MGVGLITSRKAIVLQEGTASLFCDKGHGAELLKALEIITGEKQLPHTSIPPEGAKSTRNSFFVFSFFILRKYHFVFVSYFQKMMTGKMGFESKGF